jgi:myosin heavy subunit
MYSHFNQSQKVMLLRISLILAILAGLAAVGLNVVKVKEKITTLQADLDRETKAKVAAETELASTKKELEKTSADLKQTKATLEATTAERDKAVADATAATAKADKLTADLNQTRTERDTARDELAQYKQSAMTPLQVMQSRDFIKSLQTQLEEARVVNKGLQKKADGLQAELDHYTNPDKPVTLPASLKGKVLVMDPKWSFVVLDVGDNQGVKPYGELLVNRDGKLVAKVKVTSVQKDRSVANIVPGWQLGDVLEGDQVIPAHPASS